MNCPKCGAVLPDGIRFCTSCGTPLTAQQPAAPVQPAPRGAAYAGNEFDRLDGTRKKSKTGLIIGIIIGAVVLVALVVVLLLFLLGGKKTSPTTTEIPAAPSTNSAVAAAESELAALGGGEAPSEAPAPAASEPAPAVSSTPAIVNAPITGDATKDGAMMAFGFFYTSFIDGINLMDADKLAYCSADVAKEMGDRIFNQNAQVTYSINGLYVDPDTFSYNADGSVTFYTYSDTQMYNRASGEDRGANTVYRIITCEQTGEGTWYVTKVERKDALVMYNYIDVCPYL